MASLLHLQPHIVHVKRRARDLARRICHQRILHKILQATIARQVVKLANQPAIVGCCEISDVKFVAAALAKVIVELQTRTMSNAPGRESVTVINSTWGGIAARLIVKVMPPGAASESGRKGD